MHTHRHIDVLCDVLPGVGVFLPQTLLLNVLLDALPDRVLRRALANLRNVGARELGRVLCEVLDGYLPCSGRMSGVYRVYIGRIWGV